MGKWEQQRVSTADIDGMGIDEAYSQIWKRHEESFTGFMNTPDAALPVNCKGRGQRSEPEERPAALPLLKPSRPGEVTQSTELLGRTPQKLFLQLRRIQSLLHGLRAGHMGTNAQIYRAELWGPILRGKGFKEGVAACWKVRPVKLQGSPFSLPLSFPSLECATAIFRDFEANFRKFESWHQCRRHELLEAYVRENQDKLFMLMKPTGKAPLQHLVDEQVAQILAVSEDQQMIHIANPIALHEGDRCDIDGVEVEVQEVDGPVVHVVHDHLFSNPTTFSFRTFSNSSCNTTGPSQEVLQLLARSMVETNLTIHIRLEQNVRICRTVSPPESNEKVKHLSGQLD